MKHGELMVKHIGPWAYVYFWDIDGMHKGGYSPMWNSVRDSTIYNYLRGYEPPHYPVPAIPISFDYDVCGDTVYLDMWEGIEYCRHFVWATE